MFLDDNVITREEKNAPPELAKTLVNSAEQIMQVTAGHFKRKNRVEVIPLVKYSQPESSANEATRFYKRKSGSVYGKLKYKYLGKRSEGNRFIRNTDL